MADKNGSFRPVILVVVLINLQVEHLEWLDEEVLYIYSYLLGE